MAADTLERILLIEDDSDIRTVACMALADLGGYQVEAASSGAEGLGKVGAFRPELVLLDVMMPGLDGPSTLSRLRQLPETADVPVVFVTAKAQASELAEYRRLGAAGVIVKPFDPLALPELVADLWRQGRRSLEGG